MPQLDRIALGTTLVWFICSYFVLYFFVIRYILPNILKSLKYKVKKVKKVTEGRQGNQFRVVLQLVRIKIEDLKISIFFFNKFKTFKLDSLSLAWFMTVSQDFVITETF